MTVLINIVFVWFSEAGSCRDIVTRTELFVSTNIIACRMYVCMSQLSKLFLNCFVRLWKKGMWWMEGKVRGSDCYYYFLLQTITMEIFDIHTFIQFISSSYSSIDLVKQWNVGHGHRLTALDAHTVCEHICTFVLWTKEFYFANIIGTQSSMFLWFTI